MSKIIDYKGFIEKYFTITTIDGQIVPMKLNDVQNYYYNLILKDYGEGLTPIRETGRWTAAVFHCSGYGVDKGGVRT